MKNREVLKSIVDSSAFLRKVEIEESFIHNYFLSPNKEFNKISLNKDSTYEEIYLAGLESQYYNIVLKDYSYFQYNFLEIEDKPYARYAFYPNPFDVQDENIQEYYSLYKNSDISFEDYSQAISEYKPLQKKPVIRYDLSYKQFDKLLHPASHFHFGNAENTRIATDIIYSPLLFTMFITKMYYHQEWIDLSSSINEYILDVGLFNEKNKCIKVNIFDDEYFCELQSKLINLV